MNDIGWFQCQSGKYIDTCGDVMEMNNELIIMNSVTRRGMSISIHDHTQEASGGIAMYVVMRKIRGGCFWMSLSCARQTAGQITSYLGHSCGCKHQPRQQEQRPGRGMLLQLRVVRM